MPSVPTPTAVGTLSRALPNTALYLILQKREDAPNRHADRRALRHIPPPTCRLPFSKDALREAERKHANPHRHGMAREERFSSKPANNEFPDQNDHDGNGHRAPPNACGLRECFVAVRSLRVVHLFIQERF